MKKILIISTNAIGDTYLSMAAIPYLNEKYNSIKIDFLIDPDSLFLFEDNSVNKTILVKKDILDIVKISINLMNNKYDYVFSFFPGIINSYFLVICKSFTKGGFINIIRRKEWFNRMQKGFVLQNNSKKYFFWDYHSNFLLRIEKILFELEIIESKIRKYQFNISTVKKQSEIIVLHPFAKLEFKSLTLEQLDLLIQYLNTQFRLPILIIGDNKILFLKDKFPTYVKIIAKPPLKELINLVHSRLFISVDSFPLHIADSYNTNFIGLFSATHPNSVLLNKEKSIYFKTDNFNKINGTDFINKLSTILSNQTSCNNIN